MDRKTFINRFMRFFLLGGLALMAGFLATRRKLAPGGSCIAGPACGACPESGSCELVATINKSKDG